MPHISFGYDPDVYREDQIIFLVDRLEVAVRKSIKTARPSVDYDYGVTIRGGPHPPITRSVAGLEINIDYHQEWEFREKERKVIADHLGYFVTHTLKTVEASTAGVKIRLYARIGYEGRTLK